MNKWVYAIISAGIIFIIGKFVYDNYGDQIGTVLNLTKSNPNGVQASIASKGEK